MTNWKALQVATTIDPRTKKKVYLEPKGISPSPLSMASWTPKHLRRNSGGTGKTSGKAKLKLQRLPTNVPVDKKGYTVL